MTLEEFVDSLKLPDECEYINGNYVLEYDTSDDFSDIFNYISLNKNLTCDEDSMATNDKSVFVYTDGMFEVVLKADFENDRYVITIGER